MSIKKEILKKAGVKTEEEFYEKFPSRDVFLEAHPDFEEKFNQPTKKEEGAKYRKYQPYMSKHLKFGDFLENYGKTMANMALTPIETVVGRDLYNPEFEDKTWQDINNIGSGIQAATTDVAGTIAFGPAYGLGKQGLQTGVNALDPNMSLDNTREDQLNDPNYKIGKGVAPMGNMVGNMINMDTGLGTDRGSSSASFAYGGALKKYAGGGALTEYNAGGSHEENPMGGIPVSGTESVEEGETLDNENRYVYSDRIVIDDDMIKEFSLPKRAKGKTMAAYSKLIEKENDREHDKYDKDTKRLMLDRLMEANESAKMRMFEDEYEGALKKRLGGELHELYKGGKLRPMWGGGGLTSVVKAYQNNQFIPPLKTEPNVYSGLSESDLGLGTEVIPSINPGAVNESNKALPEHTLNPQGDTRSGTEAITPGVASTDININPIHSYARLAPMVANTVAGMRTDKLNKQDYRVKGRVTAPTYNIDPVLQENRSDYNFAAGQLREATAGSSGTYLSNLANIYGKKAKANAMAYAEKENKENMMDFEAQKANIGIEEGNRRMDFAIDDWNMRSKAASRGHFMKASESLASYADAEANNALMEAYINAVARNYKYNFTRDWKKKTGKTGK